MAVLQPMPSVPISFTPPSVGPSLTQSAPRFSPSRPESPLHAFSGSRSPLPGGWAGPSVMPLAQAPSEPIAMPAMRAVAPLPGGSSPPGWSSPRPSPPQVARTPITSSHPTMLSWNSLSLGVTEAASFGRAVSPSPLPSATQTAVAPQLNSRGAASFGRAVTPSPLPSGAQTVMAPRMNSRGAFSSSAFKFYGPNDFVEHRDLQTSFGSFGLGFSVAPPAPEYQRERLVTEDTTLTNPAFELSGMPSRIDQTQSSVLSNEYGPPPGSLPPVGQVTRQPTVLAEEVAPQPAGPGLESQVQELLEVQRSMRQEISEMRGQVSTDSTELEAMRSLPPPPDASQLAWPEPSDGQSLSASGGFQQQQPISPASAASYQQSPTGSPGSYPGPAPATGLPPAPDGSFPPGGSQRSFQSPQGPQGQQQQPRAPPPEDPQVAARREHMRMRNLGYHDNIDALNTMSTHVSTKARNFHSQLRAKSPGTQRPSCC